MAVYRPPPAMMTPDFVLRDFIQVRVQMPLLTFFLVKSRMLFASKSRSTRSAYHPGTNYRSHHEKNYMMPQSTMHRLFFMFHFAGRKAKPGRPVFLLKVDWQMTVSKTVLYFDTEGVVSTCSVRELQMAPAGHSQQPGSPFVSSSSSELSSVCQRVTKSVRACLPLCLLIFSHHWYDFCILKTFLRRENSTFQQTHSASG